MQYLMIQNKGTSPIACFTTLGISTSRYADNENTIGTFGSGSKHAVLLLMRHGINPIQYCGKVSLEWYSKPDQVSAGSVDHEFNLVYYRVKGKLPDGNTVNREEKTSYTLEYGESDWDEVAMGLREFVSNALDRSADEYRSETGKTDIGYIKMCKIEAVDKNQVRAKEGTTRIFIPLTPDVQKFYSTLGKRFLHFSQPHLLNTVILPKAGRNLSDHSTGACIYKKGVFIREVRYGDSVYDYNFGDELELDESRNLDDYAVSTAAGKALKKADATILRKVVDKLVSGESVWEDKLYGLQPEWNDSEETIKKRAATWTKAIKLSTGSEDAVFCIDNKSVAQLVKDKGKLPIVIKSTTWLDAAEKMGVITDKAILSEEEAKGTIFSEPTIHVVNSVNDVWRLLESLKLTAHKSRPPVSCFTEIDGSRHGFYDPNNQTIHINTDHAGGATDELWMTCLEEIAHYITGATDNSREFQNFFMRIILNIRKGA